MYSQLSLQAHIKEVLVQSQLQLLLLMLLSLVMLQLLPSLLRLLVLLLLLLLLLVPLLLLRASVATDSDLSVPPRTSTCAAITAISASSQYSTRWCKHAVVTFILAVLQSQLVVLLRHLCELLAVVCVMHTNISGSTLSAPASAATTEIALMSLAT
jgi:hypothetical protein